MANLVVLVGVGGMLWVTSAVLEPQVAQAKSARVDLTLQRQPNESYESLVRRAEMAATSAAQTSFDQDPQVADVSVIIVGQNQGAVAPVLSLPVSRTQWYSRPDTKRWAKYFNNAKALLRFENVATTNPATAGNRTAETANPATTPGGAANSYPNQAGSTNPPATRGGAFPNRYFGSPGTANPYNSSFGPRTPGERYPGGIQRTGTPFTTPGQGANGYPEQSGTANPVTPSQTPAPGSGMTPQPALAAPVVNSGNTTTPTLPNSSNPGLPSTSTPANVLPTPVAPPVTGGTTINNPATGSFPNSSGNISR